MRGAVSIRRCFGLIGVTGLVCAAPAAARSIGPTAPIGWTHAQVISAYGSPSRLRAKDGSLQTRLSYPKLGLVLDVRKDQAGVLRVQALTLTRPKLAFDGLRVGMSRAAVFAAMRNARACSTATCHAVTGGLAFTVTFARGRLTSVKATLKATPGTTGGGGTTPPAGGGPPPGGTTAATTAPIAVPPTTTIESPLAITGVTGAPSAAQTVTLPSAVPTPAVGDVVVAGVGPATPDGLLAHVDSVARAGNNVDSQHVACVAHGRHSLGGLLGRSTGARDPSRPQAPGRRGVEADEHLQCAALHGWRLGRRLGCHTLGSALHFSAKWNLNPFASNKVTSASFSETLNEDARLAATASASASCHLDKTNVGPPITWTTEFTIGPVPVVVTTTLQFVVSGSGQVNGGVSTDVHQSFSASAGISYANGSFSPIANVQNTFGYDAPSLSANASFKAATGPELSFLLYGVAGPATQRDRRARSRGRHHAPDRPALVEPRGPAPGRNRIRDSGPRPLVVQRRPDQHLQADRAGARLPPPRVAAARPAVARVAAAPVREAEVRAVAVAVAVAAAVVAVVAAARREAVRCRCRTAADSWRCS